MIIKILGRKRLIWLGVLVTLNLLIFLGLFFHVAPQKKKFEQEARILKSAVFTIRAEIAKLEGDYALFEKKQDMIDNLRNIGYFSNQDRFRAKDRMDAIAAISDTISVSYDIKPALIEEDENTRNTDYVVIRTPVKVNVVAMDDIDFYKFVYWVDNAFSGHTSITELDLKRTRDVPEDSMDKFKAGSLPRLVNGSFSFDWRTLLSRSEINEKQGAKKR